MVKSENWQALNLLQERYREQVKCIYIDPPYNTGNDEFLYKDNYQHSSWLTLIYDRIKKSLTYLEQDSAYWMSIDDHENHRLREIADNLIGFSAFNADISVINNLKGRND